MKSLMGRLIIVAVMLLSVFAFSMSAFAEDGRPRLGLSVSQMQASPLLLQHLRLAEGEGLMVRNIAAGSELETAGLSQGDIVLAIDGHALNAPSQLEEYVSRQPKGAQVTLDVIQKGEHRQIYVKLDSLPDEIVWKYSAPVRDPGRNGLGLRSGGQMNQIQPPSGGNARGAQHSVYHTMQMTDSGMRTVTVTIDGPSDDPDTAISIEIGQDSYQTRIGEIDRLPDDAREAAHAAIDRQGSFSFGGGSDLFEEMMRQQMEQMQRMDEMFNAFGDPFGDPFNAPGVQKNSVPQDSGNVEERKPVLPGAGDIRM